jgi:hypothetical protein
MLREAPLSLFFSKTKKIESGSSAATCRSAKSEGKKRGWKKKGNRKRMLQSPWRHFIHVIAKQNQIHVLLT